MSEFASNLMESVEKIVSDLVARGREVEAEGGQKLRSVRDELRTRWQERMGALEGSIDAKIEAALKSSGVPTKDQLRALEERTEELEAAFAELLDQLGSRPAAEELVLHVVPDSAAGWKVEAEDDSVHASLHQRKSAAVEVARELAHSRTPSRLVVHRSDGTIQKHWSYEA